MNEYTHPRMDGADRTTPDRLSRWELYRLLGDPLRLRMLALAEHDELAVGELAELLNETQPTVSRHLASLRQAGLLQVRRQGTWTLARLAEGAVDDPVVNDALAAGRRVVESDGSLRRVAEVLRARERSAKEFFARGAKGSAPMGPPTELAAYLMAVAPMFTARGLAVDVGAGDGPLVEVLAPVFARVVAVDRSAVQLALCAERVSQRGFRNVELVESELDGEAVRAAAGAGADLVVASRVLHHAPRPSEAVKQLAALAAPGGLVVVVDYARHDDEGMQSAQADLWMGFETAEIERFAVAAGLENVAVARVPAPWAGQGPDRHVPWLTASGRVPMKRAPHAGGEAKKSDDTRGHKGARDMKKGTKR
ncbi:MAG: metalloregulator ArsR/SmtB family transcription factor [Polyangiales bacterium]